jgi:hypothetical protein
MGPLGGMPFYGHMPILPKAKPTTMRTGVPLLPSVLDRQKEDESNPKSNAESFRPKVDSRYVGRPLDYVKASVDHYSTTNSGYGGSSRKRESIDHYKPGHDSERREDRHSSYKSDYGRSEKSSSHYDDDYKSSSRSSSSHRNDDYKSSSKSSSCSYNNSESKSSKRRSDTPSSSSSSSDEYTKPSSSKRSSSIDRKYNSDRHPSYKSENSKRLANIYGSPEDYGRSSRDSRDSDNSSYRSSRDNESRSHRSDEREKDKYSSKY